MKKINKLFLISIIFTCLFAQQSLAITKTWNGSFTSISWNDTDNWLPVGVPQAGDDVMINMSPGPKLGITTPLLSSITIERGSILSIVNLGELNVSNSSGDAILIANGEIKNRGLIEIVGGAGTGIYLESEGTLSGDGQIKIHDFQNFGDEGIKNYGSVSIDGTLDIYRLDYFAVWNYGDFEITPNGVFNIFDNDSRGLQTAADGVTTNRGELIIKNTESQAIYCSGIMHNYNSIKIDSISSSALYILETFYNHPTGDIDIFECSYIGMLSGKIFENEGIIKIKQCDIGIEVGSSHSLNNSGVIEVDSCADDGLVIEHEFYNSGTISLKRVNYGITTFIAEPIINLGNIIIDSTRNRAIYCSEEWTNGPESSIRISNVAHGRTGMYISRDLINDGLIWISDAGLYGLRTTRTLTNNDSIVIMNSDSIGILNTGDIINNSTGNITVSNLSNPSSFAIFSENSIINDGQITVNNAAHGIENLGILINNIVGSISISDCTSDTFDSILGSSFDCFGILEIDP